MGEELDNLKIFIQTPDGKITPFEGIKTAEIICRDEIDEETYNSLIQGGIVYTSEFVLTHKEKRKWDKFLHKEIKRMERKYRTFKRQKEKVRRSRLKHSSK